MMIDKRLINLVPESKKYVFLTVLLKIVALLSNFVLVFSVAEIIKSNGQNINLPGFLIIISVFLTIFCNRLTSLASFYSSSEVKKTLRTKIYEKLLRLGPEYQEKTETAKIIQWTVEGVEQIEVWFGQYLPQFFYSMISAVLTFAVLAFVNLKMAVILLVCVPLIPMSIVAVQKIAKKILGKYMDQYANLADNYLENLQGLTTLKIYNADEDRQKKIGVEAENFRRITMKVLSFQLNSIIIMDTVAYAGAGLGIMVAVGDYLRGSMTLSNALICILLSADFFIPLRRLGSYFHTAMNGTTASGNIFKLLETEEKSGGTITIVPRVSERNSVVSDSERTNACSNDSRHAELDSASEKNAALFTVENLSYKYGERTVLQNVSFAIPYGSFTAFVGKSGSGKSTTAKVLAGINANYKGSVKIGVEIPKQVRDDEGVVRDDGANVRDDRALVQDDGGVNLGEGGIELSSVTPESLYKFCTYISHKDWIFKGTVRDCLLEGNPKATEEQMWTTLEEVQLADFIKESGGLDFEIKEDANNLSGGQKQRLSIARALLHDSEVYIFDEATSNIDVESEMAILALLHKLKGTKTIIMISHRKENCQDADQIFTFENGILQSIAASDAQEDR